MTHDASYLFLDLHAPRSVFGLPPLPPLPMHHHSAYQPQAPRGQAHHQLPPFAGALAPSYWTNAGPSHVPQSLWHSGPPDFLLPFQHYASRQSYDGSAYTLSRSDTSSAVSRDSDLSPSPEVAEVVCNAPLVAPIPLPYHSPTFLLYDLPDEDEDLSHPPYTHRPHKRKRAQEEDDVSQEVLPVPVKRRTISESAKQWDAPRGQWGNTAVPVAPVAALRHPSAGFSRRNRAR